MHCPSCGVALLPDAATCPACGVPVTVPALASASPYGDAGLAPYTVEAVPYKEFSAPARSGTPPELSFPDAIRENAPDLSAFSTTATAPQIAQNPSYAPATMAYAPAVPPVLSAPPALKTARSSRPVGILCALIVLLFLSNIGLLYFALVYQPAQLHSQADSIARTEEAQASATAYTSSPQGLYARYTSGKPSLNDTLNNNSTSLWSNYTSINGRTICQFTQGALHVINSDTAHFFYCPPSYHLLSNFVLQVQMTIIRGDYGGVVVRADSSTGSLYRFRLDPDGYFSFYLYTDRVFGDSRPLVKGYVSSMRSGLGQSNLITIIAQNSHFYLYVNKQNIASLNDSTYSYGSIGLESGDISQTTEVAFSNAEIWELP